MNKSSLDNKKTLSLALSGGGHRATIFALGALLYLIHSGRNQDVQLITSVSGGSITNAWLSLLPKSFDQLKSDSEKEKFELAVAKFSKQIAGVPFWWWLTVIAYFFNYIIWMTLDYFEVLTLGYRVFVFVSCYSILAFVTGPLSRGTLWGSRIWWNYVGVLLLGFIVGLAELVGGHQVWGIVLIVLTLLFWYTLAPRIAAYAFGMTIVNADTKTNALVPLAGKGNVEEGKKKVEQPSSKIEHIYCSTQIQVKRPFYMNREFVYSYNFGSGKPGPLRLCDAVQASANFPFAFPPRILSPGKVDLSSSYTASQENASHLVEWFRGRLSGVRIIYLALTDGGVYDNTGFAWFRENTKMQNKLNIESRFKAVDREDWKLLTSGLEGQIEGFAQKQSEVQHFNLLSRLEALLDLRMWKFLGASHGLKIRNDLYALRTVYSYIIRDVKAFDQQSSSQEGIISDSLRMRILHLSNDILQFLQDVSRMQPDSHLPDHHLKVQALLKESSADRTEVIVINSSDPFLRKPVDYDSPLSFFKAWTRPVSIMNDLVHVERISTISKNFLRQTPFRGGIVSIGDSPLTLPLHVIDKYQKFTDPEGIDQRIYQREGILEFQECLQEEDIQRRYPISEIPTDGQYLRALEVCYQGQKEFIAAVQVTREENKEIMDVRKEIANHKQLYQKELAYLRAKAEERKKLFPQDSQDYDRFKTGPYADYCFTFLSREMAKNPIVVDLEKLNKEWGEKLKQIRSRRSAISRKANTLNFKVKGGWIQASNVGTTLKPLGSNATARLLHQGYYSAMFTLYTLCAGYNLFLNGPSFYDFLNFVEKGQALPKGDKYNA